MNYEIEKKTLISNNKFEDLKAFFAKNGRLLKNFRRFSIIYFSNPSAKASENEEIDLRVRISDGKGKLTLKYGQWSGQQARAEYEVDFNTETLPQLLHIMKILGYSKGTTLYIERWNYEYQGFDISMDKYYGENEQIIEIELASDNETEAKSFETKVEALFKKFDLQALDREHYMNFVTHINSRKDWLFDFTKEDIEKWCKDKKDFIYARI